MIALWAATALAGGGGLYGEIAGGAASTDSTGFVARGTSFETGIGAYYGTYRHTFRYGKYWRLGLVSKTTKVEAVGSPLEINTSVGLKIGRGVDLMRFGAFWSVSAGTSLVYRVSSLSEFLGDDPGPPRVGVFVRGGVGLAYNVSPSLLVSGRYEPGLQFDHDGISALGGFGLGLMVRIPLVRWRFAP